VAAKIDGDPTDPGTLTPLSADMVGANAVPAGAAGDFTITQQPANTMVVSGGTATFTVGTSTDVPLCYQWQRGGVDIPGAIGPNYSLTAFQPDSGAVFSVRVSILGGRSINSANATLSVGVDNIPPTVVAVAADAYGTNVTVSFSETVDPATSQTAGNYLINNVAAASATRVNGTNVVLVPASPLQACVLQQVRVSGVLDLASNPVNPNPTTVNFTAPILLVSRTATWKYDDSGNDLGTSWSAPAFNDGAWLSGGALLGFEPAAAQIPPVVTPLSGTVTNKTAYFRIHFSLPTHPGAITHLQLIEIVDDGAVYYINNVEARRTRMPTGVITATTLASAGGPEPTDGTHTVEGPTDIPTTGLVEGDNVLAVELHPSSLTSSDAVFAAELIAVVTACGPGLNIAQSGNQAVLTWSDPTYSLQRATAVTGPYTTVAGAVSGFTTPITGNSFFRLTKP
jgi:hypothetical protein